MRIRRLYLILSLLRLVGDGRGRHCPSVSLVTVPKNPKGSLVRTNSPLVTPSYRRTKEGSWVGPRGLDCVSGTLPSRRTDSSKGEGAPVFPCRRVFLSWFRGTPSLRRPLSRGEWRVEWPGPSREVTEILNDSILLKLSPLLFPVPHGIWWFGSTWTDVRLAWSSSLLGKVGRCGRQYWSNTGRWRVRKGGDRKDRESKFD